MSDEAKTQVDEQKRKDFVVAMHNAQNLMKQALNRIEVLERALRRAAGNLDDAAHYMPEGAFLCQSTKSLRALFQEHAADARKPL